MMNNTQSSFGFDNLETNLQLNAKNKQHLLVMNIDICIKVFEIDEDY